jgi:hypothetical protein
MAWKPTPIAAVRAAERCRIGVSPIQGTVRNKIAPPSASSAILNTFVTDEILRVGGSMGSGMGRSGIAAVNCGYSARLRDDRSGHSLLQRTHLESPGSLAHAHD